MSYKFICTVENNIIYNVVVDEKGRLIEAHPSKWESKSIVGNVYIGKVSKIAKNINAAFINIGTDKDVFLQLDEKQKYLFTNGKGNNENIKVGDELLVQIIKDEQGTKAPSVTSSISITGRYLVLTYGKNFIGMSSKINNIKERKRLKLIMQDASNDLYGFIIRTNAEGVSEEDITKEKNNLIEEFDRVMRLGLYRLCFECIYKQPKGYIKLIRDLYKTEINSYHFDNLDIYEDVITFFKSEYEDISEKFQLYQDKSYNLYKLHSLSDKIEKALNEKVWLKSGANLIIQKTEALTVIDVNSSKIEKKGNVEDVIYKINLESAKEAARQIRLRNLSGIIIIDFIDMEVIENRTKLLNELEILLNKDRTKTTLIDMTPLGLVEITRKKITKTLKARMDDLL